VKSWQKGALIGGVWGVVSTVMSFVLIGVGFSHGTITNAEMIGFIILFLPGYLALEILCSPCTPSYPHWCFNRFNHRLCV
jgi:apolipoprotein N-acyltransferase